MWRVGVLSGTGTARKRTIPALLGSDLCRVTVVHGRDEERLAQIAELDPGIERTTSEQGFAGLRGRYDVVYIASPPFLHPSHLRLVVGLGLPVICEKPLVVRRHELEPLERLLSDAALPFMLAHHVRHQPAVAFIAEVLRSRRYGTPVSASLQWCFDLDHGSRNARWKLDPELGGSNALFDVGSHAIDLALHLFGTPPGVCATGHRIRSTTTFDLVTAVLGYRDHPVTVTAGQSGSDRANDLRITFPSAVLRAPGLLGEKPVVAIEIESAVGTEVRAFEPVNLYLAEVEDFCRALGGPEPAGATVADAVAGARVMFAAEESLHSGGSVIELREIA
ncbi:Gfo/Idh/MocA family oxidoreductase [Nonomuraea sp. NPDC050643]|uniref:Gfo/Idh/MocA family protein n=1 Tax=Nonomuraea sp. NPDC050643 TaxID=3155660 RepID=UPI0033FB80C3